MQVLLTVPTASIMAFSPKPLLEKKHKEAVDSDNLYFC